MGKTTIIWLTIAGALITIGSITFVIIMSINGWDFHKLSMIKFESNTYEISVYLPEKEHSSLLIRARTGDVKFNNSDAGEIYVSTSTDSIYGSLLSTKVFDVRSSTGDINVPHSVMGGKCEITTGTGDIRKTIV